MNINIDVVKKLIKDNAARHEAFIKQVEIAKRYYDCESDILFRPAKEDSEEVSLRNADNRIPWNYFGLLVDQKSAYLFTAPPTFDIGSKANNKRLVALLGDEYQINCMELCKESSCAGVGWVHYWQGDEGFDWAVVPSEEVIPIYSKNLRKKLLGVMRCYRDVTDDGDHIKVYEVWTENECQAFKLNEGADIDSLEEFRMFGFTTPLDFNEGAESVYRHNMGEVPFIPFRNNAAEKNDLEKIKKLIDVYDVVYSGFIDDIDDIQELILILTGYGGTNLNEFLSDLKKFKVIKMDADEGSGVAPLTLQIPIEARNSVLEATRKAIFELGMGFDPNPEKFGNSSGVALKFMYAMLEMKAGHLEPQFRLGFATLIRAICKANGIACNEIIQFWYRTAIKNDSEQADICAKSVGVTSKRTILKNHPFVEDVDEEMEQIAEEEQAELEKMEMYAGINGSLGGEGEE